MTDDLAQRRSAKLQRSDRTVAATRAVLLSRATELHSQRLAIIELLQAAAIRIEQLRAGRPAEQRYDPHTALFVLYVARILGVEDAEIEVSLKLCGQEE